MVAGAMYGITEYYRSSKDISTTKADVAIDAGTLFSAFESDEKAANEKYLTKVIAVKGPIGDISTDQSGANVVVLRTTDMMFGIACTMLPAESEKVSQLKKGQTVTIKGLCTGYTMDVVLTNGSLVN